MAAHNTNSKLTKNMISLNKYQIVMLIINLTCLGLLLYPYLK
jgi:hypothetical protein